MPKRIRLLLLAGVLFVSGGLLHAQKIKSKQLKKSERLNECVKYFYHPDDSSKALFKSVSVTRYDASDSTLANKRFRWKSMREYNDSGQETYWMYVDSNMTVTDSTRWVYNAKHKLLRYTKYEYDDSSQSVRMVQDERVAYDDSSRITKDSTTNVSRKSYGYGRKRSRDGGNPYKTTISAVYYKYNSAGDEIQRTLVRTHTALGYSYTSSVDEDGSLDTIMVYETYNNDHKCIYLEANVYSMLAKEYFRYDDKGNETLVADVELGDSNYKTMTYDDKGNVLESKTYKKGALTYSDIKSIDKNGTITETTETITPTVGSVCANDEVEITVTDSGGNELSHTTTKQKDGVPFVTTVVHRYTFDHGKIATDTMTDTEQGHLYSESSVEVTTIKHDERGNELEYSVISGGQYTENRRYTRKFNDKDKMTEWKEYNSCVADKPMQTSILDYYSDGLRIKERTHTEEYSVTVNTYDHDGLVLKEDCMAKGKSEEHHSHHYYNNTRYYSDDESQYGGNNDSYEIVYEYKK